MLDAFFHLFTFNKLGKFNEVMTTVEHVITIFEEEFAADKDAKNAAIDTVIKLLQDHKS
jgi:hypothetical protein